MLQEKKEAVKEVRAAVKELNRQLEALVAIHFPLNIKLHIDYNPSAFGITPQLVIDTISETIEI